jgi:hypothetical protein
MIFIVPIEPIDTRYTKQWYDGIPELLAERGDYSITVDGADDTPTLPELFNGT